MTKLNQTELAAYRAKAANSNAAQNLEKLFKASGMSRRAFSARIGLSEGVTRRISKKLANGETPDMKLATAVKLGVLTTWGVGAVVSNVATKASLTYVCRMRELKPALKKVKATKAAIRPVAKSSGKATHTLMSATSPKAVKSVSRKSKTSAIPPLVEIPVTPARASTSKAVNAKAVTSAPRKSTKSVTNKASGSTFAFPNAGRTTL